MHTLAVSHCLEDFAISQKDTLAVVPGNLLKFKNECE